MMKFLFKPLLAANYCTSQWIVNKKLPERIIPVTLHLFLTPFAFIASGLYCILLGSINFKFTSYIPILIGFGIIVLGISYGLQNLSEKVINRWGIAKEYKSLNKDQRQNRNTLSFLFFFGSFALFFYLGAKYIDAYLTS